MWKLMDSFFIKAVQNFEVQILSQLPIIDFGVPKMDSHPTKNLDAVFSVESKFRVGMILVKPVSWQVQVSNML